MFLFWFWEKKQNKTKWHKWLKVECKFQLKNKQKAWRKCRTFTKQELVHDCIQSPKNVFVLLSGPHTDLQRWRHFVNSSFRLCPSWCHLTFQVHGQTLDQWISDNVSCWMKMSCVNLSACPEAAATAPPSALFKRCRAVVHFCPFQFSFSPQSNVFPPKIELCNWPFAVCIVSGGLVYFTLLFLNWKLVIALISKTGNISMIRSSYENQ